MTKTRHHGRPRALGPGSHGDQNTRPSLGAPGAHQTDVWPSVNGMWGPARAHAIHVGVIMTVFTSITLAYNLNGFNDTDTNNMQT